MNMSKTPLKIIGIIIAIVISLYFVAPYISEMMPTKLSGRWEKISGKGFEYIEFFDNETYKSSHSNYEGYYSINGDRILLQGVLMESITFTFECKGKTLTFFNDEGEIYSVFKKQ